MPLIYLEILEDSISRGKSFFACQGAALHEWYLGSSLDEMRLKAQLAAAARQVPVSLFRLVSRVDVGEDGPFLIVRNTLHPDPRGEPILRWSLVGSVQAAELLRDVTDGPTPYFGVVIEETIDPATETIDRSK